MRVPGQKECSGGPAVRTFENMTAVAGRSVLPQSPQAHIIIGLDLLRLLVENRIAEFHTELELLSPEVTLPTNKQACHPQALSDSDRLR